MAEKTLTQSLQELSECAKEVAEQIRQRDQPPETPPARAITWTADMIKRPLDAPGQDRGGPGQRRGRH